MRTYVRASYEASSPKQHYCQFGSLCDMGGVVVTILCNEESDIACAALSPLQADSQCYARIMLIPNKYRYKQHCYKLPLPNDGQERKDRGYHLAPE